MNREQQDATVVVCTRNRPTELERCLSSLDALVPAPREVIVVNSAGDASTEAIALRHAARYIDSREPGLSHARNLGAATATSTLVAYLDDDAIADPGWISALAAPFTDPKVMVATGLINALEDSGEVGAAYRKVAFGEARAQTVDRNTARWFWLTATGHVGTGGNMMFRRQAFQLWRGFDPRLGRGAPIAGSEEHFAFLQLIELGYRCVHVPEAVVRHPAPQGIEQLHQFEIQMIENTTAFMTLLFMQCPAHRKEMLRELRRRPQASGQRGGFPDVSRSERLRAMFRGIRTYWQVRSQLSAR